MLLGNSGLNVAGFGCYSTVIWSGLQSYYYKQGTLADFVGRLNETGGYDAGGQLIWSSLQKLYPDVRLVKAAWSTNIPNAKQNFGVLTPEKCLADIRRANSLGQVTGICVDLLPNNNAKPDHIVLAVETPDELDDWLVMDPAYGDVIRFKDRYGSPLTGVYGYRIVGGSPANFPDHANASDIKAGQAVGKCLDTRYSKQDIMDGLLSA